MSGIPHTIPQAYLELAKNAEIDMIKQRVRERKATMIELAKHRVLDHYPEYCDHFEFDIQDGVLLQITNSITDALSTWPGGAYKNPITDYKKSHAQVRIFWNREKPIPLGNHLFSTVCSGLFEYVLNRFEAQLSCRQRVLLFVDIFESLLTETIKFKRSMGRPLVLYTCFCKNNKFRQFCVQLVKSFGYKWDHSVRFTRIVRDQHGNKKYEYIRNKNRSKQSHDSFLIILRQIKTDLQCTAPVDLRKNVKCLSGYIRKNMRPFTNGKAVRTIKTVKNKEHSHNSQNVNHNDNCTANQYDSAQHNMHYNSASVSRKSTASPINMVTTEPFYEHPMNRPFMVPNAQTAPEYAPPLNRHTEPAYAYSAHTRTEPTYARPLNPAPAPAYAYSSCDCCCCRHSKYIHQNNVFVPPPHSDGYFAYRGEPVHRTSQVRYDPYAMYKPRI